jgi:hypothetical protein
MTDTARYDTLVRQGVMYRYQKDTQPVGADVQNYIAFTAGPNKNLIFERQNMQSDQGDFKIGIFANAPFTGGTVVPINLNVDSTVPPSQLEGFVTEEPIVTGAPLDFANSNFTGLFNDDWTSFSTFILPKNQSIILIYVNSSVPQQAAEILVTMNMREEGR